MSQKLKKTEIKALVSLLDDPDSEIFSQVREKILTLGGDIVPVLEKEWSNNLNTTVQLRIENLIYELQVDIRLKRFIEWKEDLDPDLVKGLWLISTIQYPDYELSDLKKELELLFLEIWHKFDINSKGREAVGELNQIIFNELKFHSNTKNFHSPENSIVKSVLASRKGNPISLCMVYLIMAKKLKLPVYGVNLPNLFVLTFMEADDQFYINVFNKGLIFTKRDIQSYVEQLSLTNQDSYYLPCSNVEIVKRFLRNLIVSYDKNGQHDKKEEVRTILLYLSDENQ